MHTTSISLLERLRHLQEQAAWEQLVELYTPLLYHWARRLGLQEMDANDVVQEVFATLVKKLPELEYGPGHSFRAWLRTITGNKARDLMRRRAANPARAGSGPLHDLPAPEDDDPFWEQEYRQQLVGRALELMQRQLDSTTWKACWECVVVGRPAREVARELGMSVQAVYTARSRVLRRLRQDLQGLLD